MNCPSCNENLDSLVVAGVQVYVCEKGCGGLWFNRLAIRKLPECSGSAGQGLLLTGEADGVRVFRDVEHVCPQCKTTLLYRHFFIKKYNLEMDQCSKCGGIWVDFGRKDFFCKGMSIEAKKYLEKWKQFENALKAKFDNMGDMHPDLLESREQMILIFRFISPLGF